VRPTKALRKSQHLTGYGPAGPPNDCSPIIKGRSPGDENSVNFKRTHKILRIFIEVKVRGDTPTGLAFDNATGIPYVADTLGNRIAAIPAALFLNYPVHLGLTCLRAESSMARSVLRSRRIITSWLQTGLMETSSK
jgi:hypothetical protein